MSNCFNLKSIAINYKVGDIDKRPFVFVHGNTMNDTAGKGLLDYFKQRGHTILSYDLPGHGNSKLDTSDYVFSDLIDLNYQILKINKLIRPILCGHSLGGMIQAGTIAQFKLTDANLILCGSYDSNPFLEIQKNQGDEPIEMEQSLDEYIAEGEKLFQKQFKYDFFKNRHLDDDDVIDICRYYTQPDANAANLMSMGEFNARKELIQMEIPVLVLHGEEEVVIPKHLVDSMAAEYNKMQLAWYVGKGHNAFYQHPELTDKFLDKHYSFLMGKK